MEFFYQHFISMIVLTPIVWAVPSSGDFEDMELNYLSHKLNPIECLRLLEAMYLKKPMTDDDYAQSVTKISFDDESLLRRQLERPILSHENCLTKLQQWIHNLPEKSTAWARYAMEIALRDLGRPDLARYVKRNRRIVEYFDELSRNSRNAGKPNAIKHPTITKITEPTMVRPKSKDPPKEAVVQIYRDPEAAKATRGKSSLKNDEETSEAHGVGAERIEDDDSKTRWTAFLVLLGLIALTVLATVLFAVYKKNPGNIFPNAGKSNEDRYPLADRFGRKASTTDVDPERGTSGVCSPCGRRKKRAPSTRRRSRSPSSIRFQENIPAVEKPAKRKIVKGKSPKSDDKRRKHGCDKKCAGIVKKEVAPVVKIEKSPKTNAKKISDNNRSNDTPKTCLDLKKFHEKITNILRKDDNSCKCCECKFLGTEDEKCRGLKSFGGCGKKNICNDDKCQKLRLKSIIDMCPSTDDKSPKRTVEEARRRKKRVKKRKKRKVREKDTDKDKESEKTSPENSARSKDRRNGKIKEKKMKKGKCSVNDGCGRKTCHFGRPSLNVDNKI